METILKKIILPIVVLASMLSSTQAYMIEKSIGLCNQGNSKECFNVASTYRNMQNIEETKDYTDALKYYKKTCDLGNERGCLILGDFNQYMDKNETMALPFYQQAKTLAEKKCKNNNSEGCYYLSQIYERGQGIERNKDLSIDLLTKTAKVGKKSCEKGNGRVCGYLGYIYSTGKGVKQDTDKGKKYYEKGCEYNDALSCSKLAWKIEIEAVIDNMNKDKRTRHYTKDNAIKITNAYQKACEGGISNSCFELGLIYLNGRDIAQDTYKAKDLLRQACKGGNKNGCYDLGRLYLGAKDNVKITVNNFKAFNYLVKSCNAKQAEGCYIMGVMYEEGSGIRQDDTKAKEYYGKSCDLKFNDGCSDFARLNKLQK